MSNELPSGLGNAEIARRPNVLLIMTDQHRWDATGFSGSPIVKTPALDALAARGAVFDQAYVVSPVCMASRAAIMTGRYPDATKVRGMGLLPPTEITLAEEFKRAGYRTGLFGKLHLTPQQYTLWQHQDPYPNADVGFYLAAAGIDTPANRAALADPCRRRYGFDRVVGVEDFQWGNYLDWLKDRGPEHIPAALGENMGGRETAPHYGVDPYTRPLFADQVKGVYASSIPAELHPTRFIVEQGIEFIREHRDEPFCAVISFVDPHHPFAAPQEFTDLYPVDEMPTPPPIDTSRCYPGDLPEGVREQIAEGQGYPDALWRTIRSIYYGMISNIDEAVGRLLAELERLGLTDDTVIIFTSDHGEHAGDHRLALKGALLFDSLVRVPLVAVYPPMISAGTRVGRMVQEIDIFPTLMELAGLSVHAGVQGTSLLETLAEPDARDGESVYCALDELQNPLVFNPVYAAAQMVRTPDWKLIYFPNVRTGMLFDLTADPGETINLFHDPAYAHIRNDMTMLMLDRVYRAKDPLPLRLSQA